MPRQAIEHEAELMIRTEMLRGQFDLTAVRNLSLLELLRVEQQS